MKTASAPDTTGFDPASLITEHQAGVWRYLRVLGCDSALADDLTQDTFLAVMQVSFRELNRAATSAYLRKTAHNLFVSHHRRSGRVISIAEVEALDSAWTRWAGDDNGETLLDALRDCLHGVSARARMALELRFREHRSRAHIAEALNMSEHGAKNLMQRAKHKLKACIESKLE